MYPVNLRHAAKYKYVGCYYGNELAIVSEAFKRAGLATMCQFATTTPAKRYLYNLYVLRGETVKKCV